MLPNAFNPIFFSLYNNIFIKVKSYIINFMGMLTNWFFKYSYFLCFFSNPPPFPLTGAFLQSCLIFFKVEYNRSEIRSVLSMIDGGNKPKKQGSNSAGLSKNISAFGIAGIILI